MRKILRIPEKMFKISRLHLLCIGLITIILLLTNSQHVALSFFLGGSLIWLTFFLWGLGLTLIFQKKLVALALSVIVFKYAISGVIIYWLIEKNWFEPLWFALGVFSFALSALVYSILEALREAREGKQNGI